MPDLTAIAEALTALKAAGDIAKAMIGLRDAQTFQPKLIELNSALIEAQTKIFAVNEERAALVERVRDLEQKLVSMEAWETEKKRYELKEISPGVFAYASKESVSGSEPAHCICTACYEKRVKSILQCHTTHGRSITYLCPNCKTLIHVARP
jgi:uncharacterized coiled-coil protein SlyX